MGYHRVDTTRGMWCPKYKGLRHLVTMFRFLIWNRLLCSDYRTNWWRWKKYNCLCEIKSPIFKYNTVSQVYFVSQCLETNTWPLRRGYIFISSTGYKESLSAGRRSSIGQGLLLPKIDLRCFQSPFTRHSFVSILGDCTLMFLLGYFPNILDVYLFIVFFPSDFYSFFSFIIFFVCVCF